MKTTEWDLLTKRGGFLDNQLGKGWSAPFTGYSWKVLRAYIHLVNAWYEADRNNRPHVEVALREMVATLQPSELAAARMSIYGVGHEGAMLDLWPHIAPAESADVEAPVEGGASCR